MRCPDCTDGERQPLLFGAPYPCSTCDGTGSVDGPLKAFESMLGAMTEDSSIVRVGDVRRALGADWTGVVLSVDMVASRCVVEWDNAPPNCHSYTHSLEYVAACELISRS